MNIEYVKDVAIKEVEEIKKDYFIQQQTTDLSFKLLSELFKYLRNFKHLKILLICRQIESLKIDENKVEICAQKEVLNEILNNCETRQILEDFFKSKSLSLKFNIENEQKDKEKSLREWLGEKMKII